jgi:hypothetical protein
MNHVPRVHPAAPLGLVLLVVLATGCGDRAAEIEADAGPGSDATSPGGLAYPIVDTGQTACYSATAGITCPAAGEGYYGQDGTYSGRAFSYTDNGDGTVTDDVTGLMWVKARGDKVTWEDALAGAASCRVGGYDDWRMPTIKELYSLIDFRGKAGQTDAECEPYIDTRYFEIVFGDVTGGRVIDGQDWSATAYVGTTMMGDATTFGVNFIDGRIKGYGRTDPQTGGTKTLYARYVRLNPSYGKNAFYDRGDGTVADESTGLDWQQADSGEAMTWSAALAYCESLGLAGHADWRLPNAKELQSIVDYTRAPLVTNSAAIDPIFGVTKIESYYWTGTTHREGPGGPEGSAAVYLAFGRAMGWMQQPPNSGNYQFIDVHGAGAQRSDPKQGDPSAYPYGQGPQGDDIRILNYVRCVRGGN